MVRTIQGLALSLAWMPDWMRSSTRGTATNSVGFTADMSSVSFFTSPCSAHSKQSNAMLFCLAQWTIWFGSLNTARCTCFADIEVYRLIRRLVAAPMLCRISMSEISQ